MTDKVTLKPLGVKVLIKEEKVKEYTDGGIKIPDEIIEKEQNAQTFGILVDVGNSAFSYLEDCEIPTIGSTVYYVKYSGVGKKFGDNYYRILNDEDIYGYELVK